MVMIGRPVPRACWRWRRKFALSALRDLPNARRARVGRIGEPIDVKTEHLARLVGRPRSDARAGVELDDVLDAAASLDLNAEAWEAEAHCALR